MNRKKPVKHFVHRMHRMHRMHRNHSKKSRKSVRIYGLPRSGTNFLEYLIRQNTDFEYENEYAWNDYLGEETAVKHCPPVSHEKDVTILLFKQRGNFTKSFTNWNTAIDPHSLYDQMMIDYTTFIEAHRNSAVAVSFEKLLGSEPELMQALCVRFQVEVFEPLAIPVGYMDRDGGLSTIDQAFDPPADLSIADQAINRYLAF